jgi:uncharacterized protein (TIGR02270 family)
MNMNVDPAGGVSAGPLATVVEEHAEEASFLWLQRVAAVHAPNYSPPLLADLDERLAAHIDGLRVAGDPGWMLAEEALENEGPEDFFVATVLGIEAADGRFAGIVERAEASAATAPGVISALGWTEPKFLSGRVKSLLDASSPFRQMVGLAACAVHRKDPGPVLDRLLISADSAVRSRALRAAGELGRLDVVGAVSNALADTKAEARYLAARSAVLLGNRGKALEHLASAAFAPGARRVAAVQLALQAMDVDRGHDFLKQFADVADADRLRIIGAGIVGSVRYVPWLLEQMESAPLARLAGEAFVNITGADFNLDELETMPPETFEDGPTDDPADENVEVPEDVALPWPDVPRAKAWWDRHRSRFSASTRYFLGMPVTAASCVEVLSSGFQRQRILAAHYLCLLDPGTPLFNTSAPAWRQQGLLAGLK